MSRADFFSSGVREYDAHVQYCDILGIAISKFLEVIHDVKMFHLTFDSFFCRTILAYILYENITCKLTDVTDFYFQITFNSLVNAEQVTSFCCLNSIPFKCD